MNLVSIVTGFPTVVFTVLLGVSLVYWVFVLVGALDLDSHGAAEGAAKGVAHGAGHAHLATHADAGHVHLASHARAGHAHLATHADAGHAHLSPDAHAGGAPDAVVPPHEGAFASLFSFQSLRSAPLTIVLTIFAALGFLASALSVSTLSPSGEVSLVVGAGVLAAASVLSLFVTSVAVRPIAKLFAVRRAPGHADLVGSIVVVTTSRVTETFGQATLEDHGAGLTLQIAADASASLARGDRCVLVHWDAASGRFAVERLPDLDGAGPVRVAAEAEIEATRAQVDEPRASESKSR